MYKSIANSELRHRTWHISVLIAMLLVNLWPTDLFSQVKGYEDYPYAELFTEGKEWTLCHFGMTPGPDGKPSYTNHYMIKVKVDGSKDVNGINCKRLTIDTQSLSGGCAVCEFWLHREMANDFSNYLYRVSLGIKEEVYVYEEDRKIYFYRDPGVKFKNPEETEITLCRPYFDLLMDLNIGIGDYDPELGEIISDELIYIDGEPHRKLKGAGPKYGNLQEWATYEWIEGIGAYDGLCHYIQYFWTYAPGTTDMCAPYYLLAEVKDHGRVIYDQMDVIRELGLRVPASIDHITPATNCNHNCYDLQGRPITSPKRGELYIRDGKIRFNP